MAISKAMPRRRVVSASKPMALHVVSDWHGWDDMLGNFLPQRETVRPMAN